MKTIQFPKFTGLRCLMMPYIQGDPSSLPEEYQNYSDVVKEMVIEKDQIGYLTLDESIAKAGTPHRAYRAKYGRALHTEAGINPNKLYAWGSPPSWGGMNRVILDNDTKVMLANNVDDSCAIWNATHKNTSKDGDIGDYADQYPMSDAVLMKSGEIHKIGILTPHESLPVKKDIERQFIRIVGNGVHGREEYFTINPLMN